MSRARDKGWRANVALAVASVVATLVLVEIGMQAAALVVRVTSHQVVSGWRGTGQIRLLAVGDSNTYGLGVEEDESYPRVLEALWNADPQRPRLEVINLGFPGTSSSQLVNRLPKLLAMLRPDIVTVMVGVNDVWTVPEPISERMGWRERMDFFVWRHSRLCRLLWMLRRSSQIEMFDVPRTGSRALDPLVVQTGEERVELHYTRMVESGERPPRTPLRENLATLARQAVTAGVEPVFLTYPAELPRSQLYGGMNKVIRRVAAATGTRLIDLGPRISGICTRDACNTMLRDDHPNPLGHRQAAALILEALAPPENGRR